MPDVIEAHQEREGTSTTYPIAAPEALEVAAKVLRSEGADAIEIHPEGLYLLATFSTDESTYGTLVGVWAKPAGPSRTEVTVVTKRVAVVGLITRLTETTFHDEFALALSSTKRTASR